MTDQDVALAQLVATAAYGKLAGLGVVAGMIPISPDVDTAVTLGHLAGREHDSWQRLDTHLATLTDLGAGLLARQRPLFDEFFADATTSGWEHACAALAFSWSIANDFMTMIAQRLPTETAAVLRSVCERRDVERFALGQLQATITSEQDRERLQATVAQLHGKALAGFQHAVQDSDALDVLLDAAAEPGVASRQFAIEILGRHRARLAELGIDDPE